MTEFDNELSLIFDMIYDFNEDLECNNIQDVIITIDYIDENVDFIKVINYKGWHELKEKLNNLKLHMIKNNIHSIYKNGFGRIVIVDRKIVV